MLWLLRLAGFRGAELIAASSLQPRQLPPLSAIGPRITIIPYQVRCSCIWTELGYHAQYTCVSNSCVSTRFLRPLHCLHLRFIAVTFSSAGHCQASVHAAALHAASCGEAYGGGAPYDCNEVLWRYMPRGPFKTAVEFAAAYDKLQVVHLATPMVSMIVCVFSPCDVGLIRGPGRLLLSSAR